MVKNHAAAIVSSSGDGPKEGIFWGFRGCALCPRALKRRVFTSFPWYGIKLVFWAFCWTQGVCQGFCRWAGKSAVLPDWRNGRRRRLIIWAYELETLIWIVSNSVKLLIGQYRAKPNWERVETWRHTPKLNSMVKVKSRLQHLCGYGNIVQQENLLSYGVPVRVRHRAS